MAKKEVKKKIVKKVKKVEEAPVAAPTQDAYGNPIRA